MIPIYFITLYKLYKIFLQKKRIDNAFFCDIMLGEYKFTLVETVNFSK